MGNGISSLIFTVRSGDKALGGDIGRVVTCAAQGVNTAESYAKTGCAGSQAAGKMIQNIDKIATTDSIWGKGARGLKWAQTHVNPLIGCSVGLKIALADDKEKAFCTDVPGFMGMLASEAAFKNLQKTKPAKNLLKNIAKIGGSKHGKLAAAIAEGLAFAAASIGGYMLAAKIGETAIEAERAAKARKNLSLEA